jgi:hypothetical protein
MTQHIALLLSPVSPKTARNQSPTKKGTQSVSSTPIQSVLFQFTLKRYGIYQFLLATKIQLQKNYQKRLEILA